MCEIPVRDAVRGMKKNKGGERMQNIKRGHVGENKNRNGEEDDDERR